MNSRILLCKNIYMDRNYNNVLNYTENQMLELCSSQNHLIASANNYSFLRQTSTIMVGFTFEQCLQANYIAFQNPNYSNKWFFAWVDDVIYKGDNNTEITFTIDAWSTWFDKWTAKKCFINRQHVNDDTIGLHTIPENLDVGEVIEEQATEDVSYGNDYGFWVVVSSNWQPKDNSNGTEILESDKGYQYSGISVYNKTIFGTKLFLFKITQQSDFSNVAIFLERTNLDGHIEDVENIYILPNMAINENGLTSHTAYIEDIPFTFKTMPYSMDIKSFNTEITKRTSFTGFTPKNNKCFVFPYNYLFVTNNQGTNNIYKYEDFSTAKCVFENQFSISIGGSGRLLPKNYKNMATCDDESLALGKYPTCAWSSDAFTNWLTQNSVNIATSVALGVGGLMMSALTFGATAVPTGASAVGFAGSMGLGSAGLIANQIGQFNANTLAPNINGGQAIGDIVFTSNRNRFTFREMRVKNEYLKIIDDYFTKFGYAIKSIETPNITGRKYWNYIEIGSNEEIGYGDVPSKYMEQINNACRKGVTIWHNHENIGNYDLSNIILTN